ncbi:MAG TPA: CoA transferase [Candidatus Acidoferrales bacterium]|nr:CoA transferase [Candidatus Acidoferrales bacterium]
MSSLPLAEVRILALTQLGAGPYAMTLLGDLGAEIIKIEDPTIGGDEARTVPPFVVAGDSPYYQSLNRNAKSLTLNLRTAQGRAVFQRFVKVADVVYANTRGDLAAKLGVDYASLKEVNPRIVCCVLSGFGKTGPRAAEPGYDFLVQALAGFMSVTGDPDAPPTRCGVSIADFSGGLTSAVGLLIGLLRARATGLGCDVDVSLLDTAVSMLNYLAVWNLNNGFRLERQHDGAHQTLVPSQTFRTKDGFLVIMCMKEKFWQRLAHRVGLARLLDDPRFRTFQDRLTHRRELIALLQRIMESKTTAEWLTELRGHVPCAPVYTVEEALQDEQVVAREMVIAIAHPQFGRLREVGCPIKIDDVPPRYEPASRLGADTDELLRTLLGLADDEIAELRRQGAV